MSSDMLKREKAGLHGHIKHFQFTYNANGRLYLCPFNNYQKVNLMNAKKKT